MEQGHQTYAGQKEHHSSGICISVWAAYSPGCTESTSKCQLAMAMVAHAYEVPVLPVGPPEMNGDPEQKAKEMNMGTESTTATISQPA